MIQNNENPIKQEGKLNITVTFVDDEEEVQRCFEKAVRYILKIDI